jgi:hypothetical protein
MAITLEYIKSTDTGNAEEAAKMIELIKEAAAKQKSLGLGHPTEAVAILLEQYSVTALCEHFKEVKKPSEMHFPKFMSSYYYNDYAECKDLEAFPKMAQIELIASSQVAKLSLTVDGTHKDAAIPLIPTSVQEIVTRAKSLVGSMKIHLLFMPQWNRSPNPDPVIVGEAAGRFFEIASWDGDQFLIKEFLESLG